MNVEEIRREKKIAEERIAAVILEETRRLSKFSGLAIVSVTVKVIDVTSLTDLSPVYLPGAVHIKLQRV